MTRTFLTTAAISTAMTLALGSAAFAGQLPDNFAAIDANADGQVTYTEFSKVATKHSGMTSTAAAQKFIKISNGTTSFTEADLMTAIAMQDQPDWGQTNIVTNSQVASQPMPITTPNTAVLSSTTGADIPRWSDGTPVDLNAPSTTYEQSSEVTTGGETPALTPAPTTITTDDTVIGDVSATENSQMEVWSETEGSVDVTTPDTEADIGVEMPNLQGSVDDVKTTIETPDMKIEVEPQPEE